jgi:hypothetical protein
MPCRMACRVAGSVGPKGGGRFALDAAADALGGAEDAVAGGGGYPAGGGGCGEADGCAYAAGAAGGCAYAGGG